MGYMGLSEWKDSDNAADICFELQKAVQKVFNKEIKDKANEYNTPGPVNFGLLIEDGILPIRLLKQSQVTLLKNGLDKLIKESSKKTDPLNEENRRMHHNAYKRILKSVEKEENKFEGDIL